jgi:hypothetical protein
MSSKSRRPVRRPVRPLAPAPGIIPPGTRALPITPAQAALLTAAQQQLQAVQDRVTTLITAICAGHGVTSAAAIAVAGTAEAPTLVIQEMPASPALPPKSPASGGTTGA